MLRICDVCISLKGIQFVDRTGYHTVRVTYENGLQVYFSTEGYGMSPEEAIDFIFENIRKIRKIKGSGANG